MKFFEISKVAIFLLTSSTPWPSQFGIQKCETVSTPSSSAFFSIFFFFLSSIIKMSQEITEFRTLCEMLHMYWLIVLLFQLWMVNNIIIPILQMRRLRLTVVKSTFSKLHKVSEKQGWDLNSEELIPASRALSATRYCPFHGKTQDEKTKGVYLSQLEKKGPDLKPLAPTWELLTRTPVSSLWSCSWAATGLWGFTSRKCFKYNMQTLKCCPLN